MNASVRVSTDDALDRICFAWPPTRDANGGDQSSDFGSSNDPGFGLRCPIAVSRYDFAEDLIDSGAMWLARYFDLDGTKLLEQIQIGAFHELAGSTAAELSFESLERVHRWYLWLFLVDDVTDPAAYASSLQELRAMHAPLNRVLDGLAPEDDAPVIARMLRDLLVDLRRRGDEAYFPKLIADTRAYLQANAWEAFLRHRKSLPSSSVYEALRPDAGAAYTAFDLFPLLDERYRLTPGEQDHVCINAMRTFANLHISWVNDIYGYEREMREENPSNLVLLYEREYVASPRAAKSLAIRKCNEVLDDYLDCRRAFDALAPSVSAEARNYVRMMDQWISGSLRWHYLSRRYRTTHKVQAGQQLPRAGE